MYFSRLRLTAALAAGAATAAAAFLLAAYWDRRPLEFESLESKTHNLAPVFNRVTFATAVGQDTWMMQQSHQGRPTSEVQWAAVDRIAIIIGQVADGGDGDALSATFSQLSPGQLVTSDSYSTDNVIGYRAPCGICHNNGPRAIRPNPRSLAAPLGAWDQWRVLVWNLKIKSYGMVARSPSLSEARGRVGFRFKGPTAARTLKVKACVLCHKDSGLFARGSLTKQQFQTIKFMVDGGFMPPLGMKLSAEDKAAINGFVDL